MNDRDHQFKTQKLAEMHELSQLNPKGLDYSVRVQLLIRTPLSVHTKLPCSLTRAPVELLPSLSAFTLKSLMCKNSSMIDLDFLSTSSSDSAGLSGAGTAHISDFAMNEIKQQEDKILRISPIGSLLVIFTCFHTCFSVQMFYRILV